MASLIKVTEVNFQPRYHNIAVALDLIKTYFRFGTRLGIDVLPNIPI